MLALFQSDERLISRAAGGDREAFRLLYRQLHPLVWGFVDRRLARREDVEDLVAATFHRLLERLDRFDPKRGSVKAFVICLARSRVIDFCRLRQGVERIDPLEGVLPDGKPGPLDLLLQREELSRLAGLLAALPGETRELLLLRFGEGLSHAEIATVLGLSPEAVRQRISRALRELKEERRRTESAPRREEAPPPSPGRSGEGAAPERSTAINPSEGALHARV